MPPGSVVSNAQIPKSVCRRPDIGDISRILNPAAIDRDHGIREPGEFCRRSVRSGLPLSSVAR
jgi:hypothetical protein